MCGAFALSFIIKAFEAGGYYKYSYYRFIEPPNTVTYIKLNVPSARHLAIEKHPHST